MIRLRGKRTTSKNKEELRNRKKRKRKELMGKADRDLKKCYKGAKRSNGDRKVSYLGEPRSGKNCRRKIIKIKTGRSE